METKEQQKGTEGTNGTEEQLHPLVMSFAEPTRNYFLTMGDFSDKWDDSAADHFREDVVECCRNTTRDFLYSVVALTKGYEQILQRAMALTKWSAGFGGALSILDIEMLAERQMSRLIFKRDDQR